MGMFYWLARANMNCGEISSSWPTFDILNWNWLFFVQLCQVYSVLLQPFSDVGVLFLDHGNAQVGRSGRVALKWDTAPKWLINGCPIVCPGSWNVESTNQYASSISSIHFYNIYTPCNMVKPITNLQVWMVYTTHLYPCVSMCGNIRDGLFFALPQKNRVSSRISITIRDLRQQ